MCVPKDGESAWQGLAGAESEVKKGERSYNEKSKENGEVRGQKDRKNLER